ncbi:hypothetical protein Rsub_08536 [Raphidocelis subcapitata]|uniref:Uncharacterized protein n=1 Tax=Raphidocelis subcapitata TaxID=307507 RepID=A0A2V0PEN4_9CHLO|nr:hypothetical protein Rsub_08536 [Raphidocelis subcapitata]|eukprot:GBF95555.1 hypothetical protein Rsub_08536 [Raphidocelis subcapitata]
MDNAPSVHAMRQQLADDAMTNLVLWATGRDYDASVESLLTEWSSILGVSSDAMGGMVDSAMGGNLSPPARNRFASSGGAAAPAPRAAAAPAPAAAGMRPPAPRLSGSGGGGGGAAGGAGGGAAGGAKPARARTPTRSGGSSKRSHDSDGGGGGGSSKKAKSATAAELAAFAGVSRAEAMVGRKVRRYWPEDAGKNKGDPWFTAVVTDYDPSRRVHVLTYSLGTSREEREDVDIQQLPQGAIDLSGEWVQLDRWYGDPKKRARSYAVSVSKYLRARAAGVTAD